MEETRYKADPKAFVDDFTKVVNQWKAQRAHWEEVRQSGGYGVWGQADTFKIKLLEDLERLFHLQDQLNIMMLAALDDLYMKDG